MLGSAVTGNAHNKLSDLHPLVSVVIPAFNAEKTIDDTLKSVRRQTYTNLEIIIVDDGSTDRTRGLVSECAKEDGRIKLVTQKNSGVAAARNNGWQSARSDLIAFIDADDLWAPSKIEKQVKVMLAGGDRVGLVYTWWQVIDESNRVRYSVDGRKIEGEVLRHTFLGNFVGHGSSPLIRREALEKAGGFDSGLRQAGAHGCEDLLLYYRIALQYRFGLVPEYLTGYRVVSGRMSSDRLRMLRSFRLVAQEMKITYPEWSRTIERGVSSYVLFLIAEAIADLEFGQAVTLLWSQVREHPPDTFIMVLGVIWSRISWRLEWIERVVRSRSLKRERPPFLY